MTFTLTASQLIKLADSFRNIFHILDFSFGSFTIFSDCVIFLDNISLFVRFGLNFVIDRWTRADQARRVPKIAKNEEANPNSNHNATHGDHDQFEVA